MDKLKERALRLEAERLIREGKMPTLDDLCRVILETKKEYANKIRRARREAHGTFVPKPN